MITNKKVILIVASIVIIFLIALAVIFKQNYRPFTWDGDKCTTYTEDCMCFGSLQIAESYPMQYHCLGIKFCEDINIVECR